MPLGGGVIAGAGLIGSLMSSSSASDARKEAAAQAALQQKQIQKAVDELTSVGVPSIDAQKIAIDRYMPELQGKLKAQQLDPSAMNEISVTPQTKQAQMAALAEMQRLGKTGLGVEDRVARQQMLDQASQQDQARQSSILQSMAQRGSLDSGAQLAAQLNSKQNATEMARKSGQDLAAQAASARRNALLGAGQLGGQIRSQGFNEQSRIAQSKDAINKFNAQNSQSVADRNLRERQRISDQRMAISRDQEKYNKGLIGKQYNQRMSKAKSVAAARTGAAGLYGSNARAQAGAAGAYSNASGGILGAGIGALGKIAPYMKSGSTSGNKKELFMGPPQANGKYADGGIEKMGYEEGGAQTEGRLVPGNNYAGDELDDKINSGEMVSNVEMQHKLNEMLQELKERRNNDERVDSRLNTGELQVNAPQQEAVVNVLRGDMDLNDLPEEKVVETPEECGMRELMKMLKME